MAERSSIEVFFRALGHRDVQRAMAGIAASSRALDRTLGTVGNVGLAGVSRGLQGASGLTLSLVRNAGGLAPAFRAAQSAIGGAQRAAFGLATVIASTTGGAVALGSALAKMSQANQSINGTVLALRSLNGEIDRANGQPIFRADPVGTGLVDINGGRARQTASDLRFLNQAADEHGISVRDIARSYVQLKAATAGTTIETKTLRRVFDGVADAGTVLGLDQQSQDRALTALQQIASKGCHAPGTLILMADHSEKLVEDIKVGDLLMGPDGAPRRVEILARGTQEMFRVVPRGGFEPFIVNLDHKLRLKTGLYGSEITMVMSDYLSLPMELQNELFLINRHHVDPNVGFTVEPVGVGEFYGFQIEGDHLYLDAQGFEHHNTVTAEELRQQLGDNLPGTIQDAADAFGVSVDQFLKMVEAGEVSADEFFRRFGDKLQDKYGKAAESMSNTTRVVAGRLANAWTNAQVAVVSGSLDQVFLRILKAANQLLQTLNRNGAFTRFGENLANSLDRVTQRFEAAVNGGYDFERVLNAAARGFDRFIRFGEGVFDFTTRLFRALGILGSGFEKAGVKIRPINELLRDLGDELVSFSRSVTSGNLEGSPLTQFFAAATIAGGNFLGMLFAIAGPTGVGGLTTALERATHWVDQLGKAFETFRRGDLADGLDQTGLGMVANIAKALLLLDDLKSGAIEFTRVLTDSDYAPQGGNAQANGVAFALRELFTGGEAQNFTGANLDYQGQLEPLFALRDTLIRIGEFLVENRSALASFFDGVLDTATLVLNIIEGISNALRQIGINGDLAYLIGGVFVIGKIGGFVAPIIGAFVAIGSAVSGAFASIGTAVAAAGGGIAGLTTVVGGFVASIAPLVAAIAGALAVMYTYTRFDNQIEGGAENVNSVFLGLRASFNELTGDIEEARQLRARQQAAEQRYFEAARFDQLADDFERNRNRDFLKFREQGLNPAEAARQTEALIQSRVDLDQGFKSLTQSQSDLALQMQSLNDNLAFGRAANDNPAAQNPALSQPVIFDLGNGQQMELRGPNAATNRAQYDLLAERMRAGRAPAWEGAGR